VREFAIAVIASSGIAHAGGLEVGEQNAVSAATGGAGVARDGDPGAAWHDPAALADGGGWRVGFSLALARPALEARAMDASWHTDSDGSWQTPPHLDLSFARDRWAAGIALGVPFGGGVTWPATWPGADEAVQTQLQVFRAAPFAAWSFGAIRVAAGFHVDAGRLQITRGLDFIDTTGSVRLDLAGRGYGVDASAFWRAREDLGIGLAYRGRSTLHLDGNANFTAPDAFSDKTPDQTARTTMTMPDQLVAGARWQRDQLAVLGDVEWTHWSVNRDTTIDFANPSTPAAVQANDWHDTFSVRAGVEWRAGEIVARANSVQGGASSAGRSTGARDIVVRVGGYVDPTPVPAEHLNPTSPDGTRLGLTAGLSWQLSRSFAGDVFGEHMWILRRDTASPDTMAASYGGTAIVLGAGLRWTP
jgi:long-chain fatty acid transport protein